jgi:type II restriction/modification system DNA methylase subunit YeeA
MKGNNYVLTKSDVIKSFVSYAVGCMFGRYSLDEEGLTYAGGEWDDSKYSTFIPDKDNVLPITDEEYFKDDLVGQFVAFVKKVYGSANLEENLDFIAEALGNRGNTSREIIRNYFVRDFFKDHCQTYKKRPIYWLFDSGKENGFKTLIYLHRYNENTIGNLRIDYLHRMQRIYDGEITRMQDIIDNSPNDREVAAARKRREKLVKQLKETKEYDEKIAHLALARIAIDLDDGVKMNYEKVQTDTNGKIYWDISYITCLIIYCRVNDI